MEVIAIAFGILVVLIVGMKLMRIVMSGCMKLVVLAVLIGALAAAYYYLRSRLVI